MGPIPLTRLKTVNEDLKKELLKILLEVYMDGGYVHEVLRHSRYLT